MVVVAAGSDRRDGARDIWWWYHFASLRVVPSNTAPGEWREERRVRTKWSSVRWIVPSLDWVPTPGVTRSTPCSSVERECQRDTGDADAHADVGADDSNSDRHVHHRHFHHHRLRRLLLRRLL